MSIFLLKGRIRKSVNFMGEEIRMKSKDCLSRIKNLDNLIDAKLEQIEYLRAKATRITATVGSEKVQTSDTSDKVARTVVKIIDFENEINEDIDRLIDLKRDVTKRIDALESQEYKLLLTLRYLNYKTWEEIGVQMQYSTRHVLRMHKEGLKAFYEKMS